ncbi:hypothetical protein P5673_019375, partial [Acropora cervicornis]
MTIIIITERVRLKGFTSRHSRVAEVKKSHESKRPPTFHDLSSRADACQSGDKKCKPSSLFSPLPVRATKKHRHIIMTKHQVTDPVKSHQLLLNTFTVKCAQTGTCLTEAHLTSHRGVV